MITVSVPGPRQANQLVVNDLGIYHGKPTRTPPIPPEKASMKLLSSMLQLVRFASREVGIAAGSGSTSKSDA